MFLLAACNSEQAQVNTQSYAKKGYAKKGYVKEGQALIFGTVSYKEQGTLPRSAVLTVKLQDTSRQDVSAVVVAVQSIQLTSKPPWAFAIQYDAQKIKHNRDYTLSFRIEDEGHLYFINKSRIAAFDSVSPLKIFVSPVKNISI